MRNDPSNPNSDKISQSESVSIHLSDIMILYNNGCWCWMICRVASSNPEEDEDNPGNWI